MLRWVGVTLWAGGAYGGWITFMVKNTQTPKSASILKNRHQIRPSRRSHRPQSSL